MKKKFAKILGVTLAVVLVSSFITLPVSANPGDIDVMPKPGDGPLSGIVTLTVDWDGEELDTSDYLDMTTKWYAGYGMYPYVLGQWDGEETPDRHPFSWDSGTLDIPDFAADPAPGGPTANWSDDAIEIAREVGFISAAYDAATMTWTIVFDSTKKVEVGDWILLGAGWWPSQEVWFDGMRRFEFTVNYNGSDDLLEQYYLFDNDETITPELGLNAKGAQQKFWLNYIDVVDGQAGTATSGSTTTLTDNSQNWDEDALEDMWVHVWDTSETSWMGMRTISGNTSSSLTFFGSVTNAVADGDIYYIWSKTAWFWAFDPGVNLTTWGDAASPADVKVMAGGRPYTDSFGGDHPSMMNNVCLPDRYIEIQARAPLLGDAEIEVWTATLYDGPNGNDNGDECTVYEIGKQVASAEKKWGELDHSKLDVHIEGFEEEWEWEEMTWPEIVDIVKADLGESEEDWVEGTDHEVWVDSGDPDPEGDAVHEIVAEKVWASFLQLEDPLPAGGALVHWWLAKDTEENQAWIQDLMDDIVDRAGDNGFRGHDPDEEDSNEYWSATGDYQPTPADHPTDIIMDWITDAAGGGANPQFATETELEQFIPDHWETGDDRPWDPYLWKETPMDKPTMYPDGDTPFINWDDGAWYGRSVTMDAHPGEIPGVTMALLHNDDAEDVLIITLVEYQQDYNGENLILIQIGKKHFRLPPPPVQVKIPQIRWAGEKIVLEKDFGEQFSGNMVTFTVDQDSIGSLVPIVGDGEGNHVWTWVMPDGVARVIFESEYEGQAEVKAVLYQENQRPVHIPIDNHDFPLFYLKLESIEPLEPTPAPLLPDEDALFGVQVKGWFITKSSEHSSRPSKWLDIDPLTDSFTNVVNGGNDIPDDDHDILLPAGRWVLPDDWPTLAGIYELRRHWDLMNNWEDQVIFSGISPLGPYDVAVVTTTPPDLAEAPVIGPFNTTQPVAIEDEVIKWVATASVWADYMVTAPALDPPDAIPLPFDDDWDPIDLRNTVVPDGKIEWFDAPMPPAKVIFQIPEDQLTIDLREADKSAIDPYYDAAADIWFAPYYSQEIPAHWNIPMLGLPEGYNWDSWGLYTGTPGTPITADDGPYPFWGDLGMTTLPATDDEVIEVYSDNNGRAYVWLNALGVAGEVDIHAKADYPYQRKHPALKSDEVTQVWGPLELDSYFESITARSGDAPLEMTFRNMSTGGILPYVAAIWDWGDGTAPGTTAMAFGDEISHTYTTPGSYSPSLTITDSSVSPLVSVETKESDYILVGGGGPGDILAYYRALTGGALVADLGDVIAAANDYLGGVIPTGFTAPITLTQLIQLANEWLGL